MRQARSLILHPSSPPLPTLWESRSGAAGGIDDGALVVDHFQADTTLALG
jgi:hypothetical protein